MKDPQKKTIQISRPHQACAPTWWAKLSRLHFGLTGPSFMIKAVPGVQLGYPGRYNELIGTLS